MSLSIYGKIQRNCVTADTVENALIRFFADSRDYLKTAEAERITYWNIDRESILEVHFIREKKPPYNVWYSNILGSNFSYAQLIMFDLNKENASISTNKKIIDFFIFLRKQIESDILVTSDAHGDLCFVKANEVIWSRELSFDYSAICGEEIL